jgi:hypothetical protein
MKKMFILIVLIASLTSTSCEDESVQKVFPVEPFPKPSTNELQMLQSSKTKDSRKKNKRNFRISFDIDGLGYKVILQV